MQDSVFLLGFSVSLGTRLYVLNYRAEKANWYGRADEKCTKLMVHTYQRT